MKYVYYFTGITTKNRPYEGKPSYPNPLQGSSIFPLNRPPWTLEARKARRRIYAQFVKETQDIIYDEIFDLEAERLKYLRDMRRY